MCLLCSNTVLFYYIMYDNSVTSFQHLFSVLPLSLGHATTVLYNIVIPLFSWWLVINYCDINSAKPNTVKHTKKPSWLTVCQLSG